MEINLYNCSDDKRVASKKLTSIVSLQAVAKDNISLTHPVLYVKYNAGYVGANYIYVPEWNRYYYIDNIEYATGERMILHCSVDVLMSFYEDIMKLKCTIERQEFVNSKYFPDDLVPIRTGRYINEYKIGTLTGSAFVITTNGGHGSV